jgi:octaprenyl-diphosphate synthase
MDIVNHVFSMNGKRLRPILVFLSAKLCSDISEATYHGAVTVELLHTATLVHDDVVDESSIRRGQPSANAVFDNRRSVLVGDYILSSALHESLKTQNFEVIHIISELGKTLAEGELNQYALANEIIIDEREYFKVIDKKTASLMRACTQIGAITANAAPHIIEKLGELGQKFGICFQIRDDIFDYYKTDVGKPTGNDIREGKITLPLIHALHSAPKEIAAEMLGIINRKDYSAENIEKLHEFAKQQGGIQYAFDKMEEYLREAEQIIERLPFDNEYKRTLGLLPVYLRGRQF